MKRVLVLGGYGVFGGRVAERLADDGFEVVVAGRSRRKAEAFCAGRPGLIAAAVDRDNGFEAALRRLAPWAVVDAAGPFQKLDYGVPEACTAAGAHYVDLADARGFVTGTGALDAAARAAGVSVISGASSVPALSGAVVRSLTAGMDLVTKVELSISASNRATVGDSVVRAMLSYAGRSFPVRRAGRWETARGWTQPRRERYALPGAESLRPRWTALADVPDVQLLPERLPGQPGVSFRAGAELPLQTWALAAAALLVRLRLLRSAERLAPLVPTLRRLTGRLGSDTSAMTVEVWGRTGGRRLRRRWTLIAERGDGPHIPALAAPLLLRRLRDGGLPPGARDAGELLDLADFEPALSALAVRHAAAEADAPAPVYRQVMGPRFDALPPAVRAMHDVLSEAGAAGRADVERGLHLLARLAARLFGFPPEGRAVPVHVGFFEDARGLRWERDFAGRRFASRAQAADGLLEERFGPLRFRFELRSEPNGLSMHLQGWSVGPLPLPRALAPGGTAREWEADGRFWFDVPITLPGAGLVVRYRGWLLPAA